MKRKSIILSAVMSGILSTASGQVPEAVVELDPYVVTGTRTILRLSESPVRTEMVSSLSIDRAGARSFADAIELVPGIRIENNCQNCGTSDILLLGLEGKYSSLLFDGLPTFSGLASVYGLDQIPSLFIDRIEIVKGAGSSIYGSGAVGGVINIIARQPVESGGLIDLRYDSIKGERATQMSALGDYVSPDGRTALTVYSQISESDPVDLSGDGLSDLAKRELEVFGLRWQQELKAGELRVDYNRTTEFRRGGDHLERPDNLANISERIDTTRDSASLFWRGRSSPDLEYSVGAGFAYIDRATFYGGLFGNAVDDPLGPESVLGEGDNDQVFIDRGYRTHGEVAQDQFGFTKNWVYSVEGQVDYRWGHHLTIFGFQHHREKIDDVVPVSPFVVEYPIAADVVTSNSIGLFVQDHWELTDDWELLLGLRADKNSELDEMVISPRVSVRHQPIEELVLRATFGTGFRAPQPFDEDLHIELIAGDRTITRQAPGIKQEMSYSGLLSAVWNPLVAQGRLSMESALFYTALRDTFTNSEIRQDPATGEAFRERFNGPDAEIGGIEINIGSLPLDNLRLDLGYVFQFARFKEAVVLFDDDDGTIVEERDFLERPKHYGVAQLTWTNNAFADVSLSAVYTGSMKNINDRTGILNEDTGSYLVWNLSLSRTFEFGGFPDLTMTAGVKNLTDDRQKDLETGFDRDPYYLHGPRTPRTFYVGGRLRF